MKQKEIVQLAFAVVLLVAACFAVYKLAVPSRGGAHKGATYEVVTPISASFDASAQQKLDDPLTARDFYVKPDLHSGIGNPQPFTPLK